MENKMKQLIFSTILTLSIMISGKAMEKPILDNIENSGISNNPKLHYKSEEAQKIIQIALQCKKNGNIDKARLYLKKAKEVEELKEAQNKIKKSVSKSQTELKKEVQKQEEQSKLSVIKNIFYQIGDGIVKFFGYIMPTK